MLTLYGISASRAFRNLWLLEELGLDYRHEPVDYRGGAAETPAMLAINPNGHIPVLSDGEQHFYESMAINLYLAARYDTDHLLWPADPVAQGHVYQWSFWVMTEVEASALAVLMHKRVLPEPQRDADKLARHTGILKKPLAVLDAALTERPWLLGDQFTLADLNTAAVLAWARAARMDLTAYPQLTAWIKSCMARPGFRRANRKR